MTNLSGDNKICCACGTRRFICECDGCHQSFCVTHVSIHRAELKNQFDSIQDQYQNLQCIYNEHQKCQEHPLFSSIDVWEQESIAKIQEIAQNARDELRKIHDEANNRMKILLQDLSETLDIGRQTDEYTETELKRWGEQLTNIKEQLETPCHIELIPDATIPPINFIKIHIVNATIALERLVNDQTAESSNDATMIKLTVEKECEITHLQKAADAVDSLIVKSAESTESTMTIQEENLTNPKLSAVPLIETNHLLDPTEAIDILLLKLASTRESRLLEIFNDLNVSSLQTFNQNNEFLTALTSCFQPIIFLDTPNLSHGELSCLLDIVSERENVHHIYIMGSPSDQDEERSYFFRRYSKIKAMFDNEQRLMVQWLIDTANEYKRKGDGYVELGDKDKGRICFEKGIALYQSLSEFLNKKRRLR